MSSLNSFLQSQRAKFIAWSILAIVLAAGLFYGGAEYGYYKARIPASPFTARNFQPGLYGTQGGQVPQGGYPNRRRYGNYNQQAVPTASPTPVNTDGTL